MKEGSQKVKNEVVGDFLKFRIATRKTLKEIADETKLSYPTICKIQRGEDISILTGAVIREYLERKTKGVEK